MMLGLALCTLVAGVLPAVAAYVGQLIVDGVLAAMEAYQASKAPSLWEAITPVLGLVALEGAIIALIALAQRGLSAQQALLRALLGQKVNVMILEKAGTLSLGQFEDSELYDKLTRARREASTRPLALVTKTFGLLQNAISLVSFGVLLVQFSPWALLILVAGALPVFLQRYRAIFQQLFAEDRRLTQGIQPGDGLRFEQVSFAYPGRRGEGAGTGSRRLSGQAATPQGISCSGQRAGPTCRV